MKEDIPESMDATVNREKKEMVTFGGMARTESGKLARSDYFKFLNLDLDKYDDLEFTPAQAKKVHQHLLKLSTGASAMVPIYCAPTCPFRDRCVFFQMDMAPFGKQCLNETTLIKQWTMDFMTEYDVDPNNFTEVTYVNELVELEILQMRLNMNLAKAENAELIIDQTIGVDREGDPIVQKSVSPFLEAKEKLWARKSKIIKLMVGDRQEKYKKEAALKIKIDDDPSSQMSRMRSKLESLSRGMDDIETSKKMTPEDIIDQIDE